MELGRGLAKVPGPYPGVQGEAQKVERLIEASGVGPPQPSHMLGVGEVRGCQPGQESPTPREWRKQPGL